MDPDGFVFFPRNLPCATWPLFVLVKRSSRTLVGPSNFEFLPFSRVPPLLCYPEFVLFFEVPYSRDRWQPVFAHSVLLFALLLACRTPGTPVPCKAGLEWTPRMGGSATTGSHDTRPRAPGKPLFTLFPGGSLYRSHLLLRDPGAGSTNTPFYTPHACFVPLPFSFEFVYLRYVFTEYPYIRAIRHSPLASHQTPHACDLSGNSLNCPRTLTSA